MIQAFVRFLKCALGYLDVVFLKREEIANFMLDEWRSAQ